MRSGPGFDKTVEDDGNDDERSRRLLATAEKAAVERAEAMHAREVQENEDLAKQAKQDLLKMESKRNKGGAPHQGCSLQPVACNLPAICNLPAA